VSDGGELPKSTHSEVLDICGYRLTAHVLSSGERVYEDTPELRRLLLDLQVNLGVNMTLDEENTEGVVPPAQGETKCSDP